MSGRRFAIFDLDNCISDDRWRIGRINWRTDDPDERYRVYHALSPFDAPGNFHVAHALAGEGLRLVVLTGRPVEHHEATREWLLRNGLWWSVHALIMRNPKDRRHAPELKGWMLDQLWHYDVPLDRIEHAYDDHPGVVDMYHRRGIASELLAIHSISAYAPPNERTPA